jgi:hypothetical protein
LKGALIGRVNIADINMHLRGNGWLAISTISEHYYGVVNPNFCVAELPKGIGEAA